jgi:hypothetical protein
MYQQPTAPQSIGGVLDSGFKLFRACFIQTFLLAAAAAFVAAPAGPAAQYFQTRPLGMATIGIGGAGVIVALILIMILTAALVLRIDAVAHNRELGVGETLSGGANRALKLFAASLLCGLAILCGFMLLIIPGFIVIIWLIFAPYVAVIDGYGPIESLRYSHRLVRGHWWRTAALLTIIGIIAIVLYMALGIAVGISVAMNPEMIAVGVMPWYIDFLVTPVISGVATPLGYSMLFAIMYDLKLRHEGADLAARIAAAA